MNGGFAGFLATVRGGPEDKPDALTRARMAPDRPDEPYDDDERQAALLARHYAPGAVTDLAQRYADTMSELATVQEANESSRKRQERIARDHATGRITAFDIAAMDFAEPDVHRAEQLERRAESLRGQLAGASALIAPAAQRAPDEFASANRAAHELFTATTRQRWAEVQAGRPAARRRVPFDGRGSIAVRGEMTCEECIAAGATPEESFLIHADPQPVQLTDEDLAEYARQTGQRYQPVQTPRDDYGVAVR